MTKAIRITPTLCLMIAPPSTRLRAVAAVAAAHRPRSPQDPRWTQQQQQGASASLLVITRPILATRK